MVPLSAIPACQAQAAVTSAAATAAPAPGTTGESGLGSASAKATTTGQKSGADNGQAGARLGLVIAFTFVGVLQFLH